MRPRLVPQYFGADDSIKADKTAARHTKQFNRKPGRTLETDWQPIFPTNRPQLTLFHLLIWMSALTLIFVSQQSHFFHAGRALPLALDGGWSPLVIACSMAFSLLNDVMVAIGICGLADAIRRMVRGTPYFHHPGHWLLVIAGGAGVLGVLAGYLKQLLLLLEDSPLFSMDIQMILAIGAVLMASAQAVAFGLVLKFHDAKGWWKILFVALATGSVLGLLRESFALLTLPYVRVHYLSWVPWQWTSSQWSDIYFSLGLAIWCILPVIALSLAAAIFGDRRETSRDWPHWVGVLVVLWITFRNLLGAIPIIQFAIMGM